MRISYVVALVLLAIMTSMLISTMSAPSAYANFTEASAQPGEEFTVVGTLSRTEPVVYDPSKDPNLVSFYMLDKQGQKFHVLLNDSKPQDMERSEDVVVKGRVNGKVFHAHTILLKCPSKYEEENTFTTEYSSK